MIRKFKSLFIIIFVLLLGTLMVLAQDGTDDQGNPNDPNDSDRANACFEGGSMEGKCDTEWEWICGWHIIRLDTGLISLDEFPEDCASLLPGAPCAANDFFVLNPGAPFGSVSSPGVLGNDTCFEVVSFSKPTVLQGGSVSFLNVSANGAIQYEVTEPFTAFTFSYTTETGASATVTIRHDFNFGECEGPCGPPA